ncbi:hypothetical protein FRC11_012516 [Ceratobasidium sp. 423]|nr:hypothetical protein FRC11_012516 [Ceratobasidium sp. 423]
MTHDALHMKKLWLMDEEELQKLWDAGETSKPNLKEKVKEKTKVKEKVPVPNPSGSKVQAMGPAKKILATSSALSLVEHVSAKCKHPSPSTSKPQKSKAPSKSTMVKHVWLVCPAVLGTHGTRDGPTLVQSQSEEDSNLEGEDKDEDKDEDEEESEMEGEDEEDGNGKLTKLIWCIKLQKLSKGNAGHGKTKDFTSKVKKMVDLATIHLCAKLSTTGMFCSPDEYKALVNKCWVWAADEYHVDYQSSKYKIQKTHSQMIHDRVNSFCSCIWDRLRSAIARTYQLLGEGQTPKEAEEHIVGLLPNIFHTKVSAKKGIGHFQHDYLQDAIFEAYYTSNNPIREQAGHPVVEQEVKPIMNILEDNDFGKDILTVEELKILQ